MPDIYQELNRLAESDMYPLHMPGHKRNLQSTPLQGAFRCDITEIDDFDYLHDEKGIILEAEQRANALYGADYTYFLVNGSTSGVLSAVSAALQEGGAILAARGSHRSFYHAAYLRRLEIEYLKAKMIQPYGIFDGYTAEDVERALDNSKRNIKAVFITSPTYEGRCSDVAGIAAVCHKRGIPLIVDEAHGSHFGLGEGVPQGAVQQGADLVIHSLHKTLPAMTQTALIHLQGDLVDKAVLKRFLGIYQSSSPSYILMSSIDLCINQMQEEGHEYIRRLTQYRELIQTEAQNLKHIRVPGRDELEDPAKVLVYVDPAAMTGQQLYDILREEYHLQLEMAGEKYALAIITGSDREEGIKRLSAALKEIDASLEAREPAQTQPTPHYDFSAKEIPQEALPLWRAWDEEKETVPLKQAAGRIAAGFVNLYPPGIPLIVPGEMITEDLIEDILRYLSLNLNVQGILNGEIRGNKGIIEDKERGIICVKQK